MLKKEILKKKKITRRKKRNDVKIKSGIKKLEFAKKNPLYLVTKKLDDALEKKEKQNRLGTLRR